MPTPTRSTIGTDITRWIEQFDKFDRPDASALIHDLTLISNSQFETALNEQIDRICRKYKKVALFPVLEIAQENLPYATPIAKSLLSNAIIPVRRLAGSSKKISYFISRQKEINPRRIADVPTEQSMIAEKIRAIIYIDDFIGSGKRIIDFWHYFVNKKTKSWMSYKKCDVFFVSYAAMTNGIANIIKQCRGIKSDEFYSELKDATFNNKPNVVRLCDKYISNFSATSIYGYRNTLSNIVFEWKCPNNTPPLLWMNKHWTPLFLNRNVSSNIFKQLCELKNEKIAERLWSAGQFRVAYTILDNINRLTQDDINFISLLSLYAKKMTQEKIKKLLQLSTVEFENILRYATNCRAIENNKISEFGLALLESFRRISAKKKNSSSHSRRNELIYLPNQYKGIVHHLA